MYSKELKKDSFVLFISCTVVYNNLFNPKCTFASQLWPRKMYIIDLTICKVENIIKSRNYNKSQIYLQVKYCGSECSISRWIVSSILYTHPSPPFFGAQKLAYPSESPPSVWPVGPSVSKAD